MVINFFFIALEKFCTYNGRSDEFQKKAQFSGQICLLDKNFFQWKVIDMFRMTTLLKR